MISMTCSNDGRLLLVACQDGSLLCFNVTVSEMTQRWKLDRFHSHGENVQSTSRISANTNYGPIHSLTFGTEDWNLHLAVLVDSQLGQVKVLNCIRDSNPIVAYYTPSSSPSDFLYAACFDARENVLWVGTREGSVQQWNMDKNTFSVLNTLPSPSLIADDSEDVQWSVTHMDRTGSSLMIGYCRVFPADPGDVDPDDLDDEADHAANVLIYDIENEAFTDLEDVISFFTAPKFGRHVFYTTPLPISDTVFCVASNLGSEVALLAPCVGDAGMEWNVLELQEECKAMCPLTPEDDFSFSTGIATIANEEKQVLVLVSATDGSISVFGLLHRNEEKYADLVVGKESCDLISLVEHVLEEEKVMQEVPRQKEEIQELKSNPLQGTPESSKSGPIFGEATSPIFGGGCFPATTGTTTPFGTGNGTNPSASTAFETIAKPENERTTLGSNPLFGSSTSFTQFSPTFGLSSSKPGAFSLSGGSYSQTTTGITPVGSSAASTSNVFGSGSKAPVFGSGATIPSFGSFGLSSGTPQPGFGTLAQEGAKASSATGFGFGNVKKESPFGTGGPAIGMDPRMVKPLFGSSTKDDSNEKESKDEPNQIEEPKDDSVGDQCDNVKVPAFDISSAEGERAAKGFDTIDAGKTSKVPIDKLDDLLDEIGEGFHGEELNKQILLLDPEHTGFVSRSGFIKWYCGLVEGSDDDESGGSLDTEEREEREEERQKAIEVFESVTGDRDERLRSENFKDLLEGLGSTYCEEEHRRTIRKISDDGGYISLSAFLHWYIEWLFGGEEDSQSDESQDIVNEESAISEDNKNSEKSTWGSSFGRDVNKWKCDTCMAQNDDDVNECACCGAVRPGFELKVDSIKQATSSSSAFTFSAAGVTIPNEIKSKSEGGSSTGFSFGFDSKKSPVPASVQVEKASSGFSFGSTAFGSGSQGGNTSTTSSFSFAKPSTQKESSGGNPLVTTKAPKPFGGGSATTVAAKDKAPAVSSGYPPLSESAPKPFANVSKVSISRSNASEGTLTEQIFLGGRNVSRTFIASTEYEFQFWTFANEFHRLLVDLGSEEIESRKISENDLKGAFSKVEKLKCTSSLIAKKIVRNEEDIIILMSKKDDIERQIQESKQFISRQNDRNEVGGLSESQPLDWESEKIRRRLNNKAILSQRQLSRAHTKLVLFEKMNKLLSQNRSSVSFTSPLRQRRPTKDPKKEAINLIFDSLRSGYDRTKEISALSQSLFTKAGNESAKLPSTRDQNEVKRKTWKDRDHFHSRVLAPFENNVQSTKRFTNLEIKGALAKLKTETCVLNSFSHGDFIQRNEVNKDFSRFGSNQKLKLMNSVSTDTAPTLFLSPFKNSSEVRQGWDKTDESQIDAVKLSLPSSISKIDASQASRMALIPFGTTPEKMMKARNVRKLGKQHELDDFADQNLNDKSSAENTSQKREVKADKEPVKTGNFSFSTSQAKGESTTTLASTKSGNTQSITFATPTQSLSGVMKKEKRAAISDVAVAPIGSKKKEVKGSTTSSPFGNISDIGSSLDVSGLSFKKSTSFADVGNTQTQAEQDNSAIDYEKLLSDFYKIHNPQKLGDIGATLIRYKVRMVIIFSLSNSLVLFLNEKVS